MTVKKSTHTNYQPSSVDPLSAGFDPFRLDRLRDRYQAGVDDGEVPGAVVLVMRDGRTVYHEAIGFADRSAGVAMTTDTLFWLASMTKPITSVAAFMLVEEGHIDLSAPVSRYLAAFARTTLGTTDSDGSLKRTPTIREPTVHDLMRHTAGMVYGDLGNTVVHQKYVAASLFTTSRDLAHLVDRLADLPLAHEPGTAFEYSMATDVLGRLIEVVADEPLEQHLERRVLGPLGMTSTGFQVPEGRLIAWSDDIPPGELKNAMEKTCRALPVITSGGGGLYGTAHDYSRFAQMLLNGGELEGERLLSPRSVAYMTANHLFDSIVMPTGHTETLNVIAPIPELGQGFGLGFAVRTDPGLHPAPGSVGEFYWAGAGGTYFWVDPAEALAVVALTAQPNAGDKVRFRQLPRALVYQAMVDSRQGIGNAGGRTMAIRRTGISNPRLSRHAPSAVLP